MLSAIAGLLTAGITPVLAQAISSKQAFDYRAHLLEIGVFVVVFATLIAIIIILLQMNARRKATEHRLIMLLKSENVSRRQLLAICNNAPSGIILVDAQGRYQLVSKTFANWCMCAPSSLIGLTATDVLPSDEATKYGARGRDVMNSGNAIASEDERCFADGITRHMISHTVPIITDDGAVEGLVAVITDISPRVKMEEELRHEKERAETYLQIAEAIILELDRDGNVVRINPRGCELLGYSEEELIGHNWFQTVIPDEINDLVLTVFNQIVNGDKEPVKHYENDIVAKSGKRLRVFWHNTLVRAGDGRITGTLSSGQDITARVNAEERLRHAQKMEAVGQLTGGVAHDFNNILNIMIGNAEFLHDHLKEDETAQRNITAIVRAVDRASSLTSRLLAYSRQQTLSPKASSVTRLVGGIDDMLRRTLGEAVDMRVTIAPDLWPVLIDPHQFENALVNLALNARDAMAQGGRLVIEAANISLDETYSKQFDEVQPGEYVQICVSDTGTGMTLETQKQAIEPFYTTKDIGKGSGLGLSMVYGFTKQSGGHLTIYSELGHGTTICLYIPRSPERAGVGHIDNTHEEIPSHPRGRGRILVVEDDENVRAIPVRILRDSGYEIVEAGNGKEALAALRDLPPFDLLFTDVVLPDGMNGMDIATEARRIQADIKVLYTTGYSESILFNHAATQDEFKIVNKPYRRTELLDKIRDALQSNPA